MTRDLGTAQRDVLSQLIARGLETEPDALKPLRFVDFNKLVDIHDHEEHFLFTTFVSSLVDTHGKRRASGEGPAEVTATDVRDAILTLGSAVEKASESTIATGSKSIVKDACPYC